MSEFDGPIMATLVQNNAALRAKNAELVAERDAAREYGVQARLREKAAEDRRIHDTDALRAQNAELVAALKDIKRYANDHDDEWVPERVDRALVAAGQP